MGSEVRKVGCKARAFGGAEMWSVLHRGQEPPPCLGLGGAVLGGGSLRRTQERSRWDNRGPQPSFWPQPCLYSLPSDAEFNPQGPETVSIWPAQKPLSPGARPFTLELPPQPTGGQSMSGHWYVMGQDGEPQDPVQLDSWKSCFLPQRETKAQREATSLPETRGGQQLNQVPGDHPLRGRPSSGPGDGAMA